MRHVHYVHHRSSVPTPFSTYAFHWVEAAMLSSVMILLLMVWDLGIGTVLLFPVVSLLLNNIGHMNYAVFPKATSDQLPSACLRHTLHHTRVRGNYGFYLPWLDQVLRTRIAGRELHDEHS
jgi:sterol desaturase/sphingolipid hydroxylase (fatty acid hydroxylase superfamily)